MWGDLCFITVTALGKTNSLFYYIILYDSKFGGKF